MRPGDKAPDFELSDQTGTPRKLSDMLAAGPVVVYFYPAAMTPGCTKEGCHFRDLASDFAAVGAQRVGISSDGVDKQKQFSDKHHFDFPLLADSDGAVARAYGVRRAVPAMGTKRATFVVDTDGTILDVVRSEIRFAKHGDQSLETLRRRARA